MQRSGAVVSVKTAHCNATLYYLSRTESEQFSQSENDTRDRMLVDLY